MRELIKYFLKVRHSKFNVLEKDLEDYINELKVKFPNDADLGKFIRNN